MNLAPNISQDAGYSYIWHTMDEDTRSIVCTLSGLSTEAIFCHWRQLSNVERVALRSSLSSIIADHWHSQKKRMPVSVVMAEEGPQGLDV